MHTVKRAVIVAAGKGERLRPVTNVIPKPLVPVNGKRMIETVIEALRQNGITEIYVVVGYMKELFTYLPDRYPGLTLIENPHYADCNNIASLYAAREHIADAIILDGDQIIYDPSILSPSFERSGYNAIYTEEPTNEWLMTVNEDGVVTHCSRTGGDHGWQLFSVSRWSAEDAAKLKRHIEIEFEEKKNTRIYWDDVAMFCYPSDYTLGIRKMRPGDLIEIDSFEELVTADESFSAWRRA